MKPAEIHRRLEEIRSRCLPEVLASIADVARRSSPPGSSLVRMSDYHFETGGKRLRGLLPLLVADLLETDPRAAVPFGAACEMLHNATLVHDDLQDGDTHRRGRATVWAKFGAAQAINLGDAMFYYTILLIQELPVPASVVQDLIGLTVSDTIQVVDGQEREFALKSNPTPTLADYVRMVEGKTSALMSLSLSGGALVAGADASTVDALRSVGRHLGVLFQIQDDVLDVYGDKGRQRTGEDIAEGKRSVLAVHAAEQLDPDRRRSLLAILDRPRDDTTDEDIREVRRLFDRVDSLSFALAEIERRRVRAEAAAASTRIASLVGLADYLAGLFVAPIEDLIEVAR